MDRNYSRRFTLMGKSDIRNDVKTESSFIKDIDIVNEFLVEKAVLEDIDEKEKIYMASEDIGDNYLDYNHMLGYSHESHDTLDEITKKFRKQLDELKNEGIINSDEFEIINKAGNGQTKESVNILSNSPVEVAQDDIMLHNEEDVEYVFKKAENIIPFRTNPKVEWIKIRPEYLYIVPDMDLSMISSPLIFIGQKIYGHIILGRIKQGDIREYYVGIPDKFKKTKADNINMYFGTYENQPLKEGVFGYWIYKVRKEEYSESTQESMGTRRISK